VPFHSFPAREVRLTRQFLLHVLEVLVSEAIGSDQSSGLGITWNSMKSQSTAAQVSIEERRTDVLNDSGRSLS
jgi:hypothetical protein